MHAARVRACRLVSANEFFPRRRWPRPRSCGALDFFHQRGTDNSGIGESAENGDMSRQARFRIRSRAEVSLRVRARRTSAGKSSGRFSCAPVTPVRETRYRNPLLASAIRANRSSVVVGAARKTVSRLFARIAARYSAASSGVRSVISAPSAPAAAARCANCATPICRTGLK